jgi:dTMP kinase
MRIGTAKVDQLNGKHKEQEVKVIAEHSIPGLFEPAALPLTTHHYPGVLMTFCGVDGAGKSSLINAVADHCAEKGVAYVRTFTPTARIRQDPVFRALVGHQPYRDRPTDLLGITLSIMGDLAQHLTDTIVPGLERGDIVICDRYVATSHAEVIARSESAAVLSTLAAITANLIKPDLAFGLVVSPAAARRRVLERNDPNDQPPPALFFQRQVHAYQTAIDVNGLIRIDTEQPFASCRTKVLQHLHGIERMQHRFSA